MSANGINFAKLRFRMPFFLSILLLLTACVMPPPVEELPELQNSPPRILPNSLTPQSTSGFKRVSIRCPDVEFYASLTDPDVGDTLYWRVFLDYFADPYPLDTEVRPISPDPRGKQVSHPIFFTIDPSDERFDVHSRLGEPHLVELLVADRPFYDNDREPLARTAGEENEDGEIEEGEVDSFVWTLMLTDEPCGGGS